MHWYEFWNSSRPEPLASSIRPTDGCLRSHLNAEAAGDPCRGTTRARTADSWENRDLADRCITRGLPRVIVNPASYGNILRILQSPGLVVINYEMVHDTRIIPNWRGNGRRGAPAFDSVHG